MSNHKAVDTIELIEIDIKKFELADLDTKKNITQKLKKACESSGFFLLSGHGISDEVIQEMYDISYQFFKLPTAVKERCMRGYLGFNRGYVAKQFESKNAFSEGAPLDLNEVFMMGRELSEDHLDCLSKLSEVDLDQEFLENIWPKEFPNMKLIYHKYFEFMFFLSIRINSLIKYTFKDSPFTIPNLSEASPEMTISYYPSVNKIPEEGQLRISPHEDHCMFTILLPPKKEGKTDDIEGLGGLELLCEDNQWRRAVYYKPYTVFVVNCAHTLRFISNVQIASSIHRVSTPVPKNEIDNTRLTFAYNATAVWAHHRHTREEINSLHKKGTEENS